MKIRLTLSLLLVLLLLCQFLSAQVVFGEEQIIIDDKNVSENTWQIELIDLDKDDDLDLIAIGISEEELVWYENYDGLGSFGPKIFISGVGSSRNFLAEDIDQDGNIDIYLSGIWYLNDGNGVFKDFIYLTGGVTDEMASELADLNGDGLKDLVVLGLWKGLFWYESLDGQGNFGPIQAIDEDLTKSFYMSTGDLDKDGDIDIAYAGVGAMYVYWNSDGDGSFSAKEEIYDYNGGETASRIKVADIDMDGDQDVITTVKFGEDIVWIPNIDGQGSFGDGILIDSLSDSRGFYLGDLDEDGDPDLLIADSRQKAINKYENDGIGNFTKLEPANSQVYFASDVTLGDINGDLIDDVVFCSSLDNEIGFNAGINGSTYGPIQYLYEQCSGARVVFAGDIDGDKDQDVIVASEFDSKISWFENKDGLGNFGGQNTIYDDIRNVTSVHMADLDGDGDLDALGTLYNPGEVIKIDNDNGSFGAAIIMFEISKPQDITAGDLDQDGDIDVVVVCRGGDGLNWFENNGNGEFGSAIELPGLYHSGRAVRLDDLNGDGKLDVLVANQSSSKVSWYENLGGGSFGGEVFINTSLVFPFDVYSFDLDGDGDKDVMAPSQVTDKIAWFENLDGLGSFGPERIIALNINEPTGIIAADFDQDGDGDIIATSALDGKFFLFEHIDGNGLFSDAVTLISNAGDAKGLFVRDLDNDGDLDVVTTAPENGKVSWLRNLAKEPAIQGICYWDKNDNGFREEGEIGLLNHTVTIEPEALAVSTDQLGIFRFYVNDGDYQIAANPSEDWSLTSNPSSYSVTVDGELLDSLEFGMSPLSEIVEMSPSITAGPTRCGFTIPVWVQIENSGTVTKDGQCVLVIDEKIDFIQANPMPDLIDGNKFYWNISSLDPSYLFKSKLILRMPGVEFLGETISFNATSYYKDDNGDLIENLSENYLSVINCSVDPNDKLNSPSGVQEEKYTLFNETLHYTIRFQNTGTDTAFNVRLEDQLDSDLDWNSLKIESASHNYRTTLDTDTGILNVFFENILLPDSTTNEVESHGFFKYKIQHKADLGEGTEITNSADIYFDFNPPVITNITLNTMVTDLPLGVLDPGLDVKIYAYPNPATESINFYFLDLKQEATFTLRLFDIKGDQLDEQRWNGKDQLTISLSGLVSGVYLYQIFLDTDSVFLCGKFVKQ